MRWLGAAVLAGAALVATSVSAQPGVSFRVIGPGTASCGEWTAERQKDSTIAVAFAVWVEGFVTATEIAHPIIVPGVRHTDSAGMAAWIDNWCRVHPLEDIANASNALVHELSKSGK